MLLRRDCLSAHKCGFALRRAVHYCVDESPSLTAGERAKPAPERPRIDAKLL
jgi:hypothetical protein